MYENIRKIEDLKLKNKTVLVRTNFDVPLENGEILDETRVKAAVKTLDYLLKQNCKVVVISHLGRPEGEEEDEFSLMPVRFALGRHLNVPIKFAHIQACENSIKFMEQGEILLLENIRFNSEEKSTNKKEIEKLFAPLIGQCDFYINDSFGVYREHASVAYLPKVMRSAAGYGILNEIESLKKLVNEPEKPFVLVLGGAKIDTKLPAVETLIDDVDTIVVGGKIAYAFLKAQGVEIGKVEIDKDEVKNAEKILKLAKSQGTEILLPVDHIAGEEFEESTKPIDVETQQLPKNLYGLDIGEKTQKMYREVIESARTVLWNGPMGVFEWENFNKGTEAVGEFIALSTSKSAYKVAAGGETSYAMNILKIKQKRFNHISIGGGMTLKYLGGESFKVLDILTGEQKL